ncbi:MAG: zinc ribbon domain-containing protein [Erysipelotrichaceae bacterium]
MKCKKCGAELSPTDAFCGNCGNKVVVQDEFVTSEFQIKIDTDQNNLDPLNYSPYNSRGYSPNTAQPYYDNNNRNYDNNPTNAEKGKSNLSTLIIILVWILLLLVVSFTAFNFLLMTDRIDTFKYDFLAGYKDSLGEFLNISDNSDYAEETNSDSVYEQVPTEQTTTPVIAIEPITQQASTETTANDPQNNIPLELQQYASGLIYEGKTYRIALQEDDWYINYRSSPQLIDKDKADYNVLGKMKHGTEIYVEYIYNGTWAVFYKDGRYVFSSMYASNNPSLNRLMDVV